MNAVFLSYAEEDSVPARRIHQAFQRAGVDVWGYKENGRIGVHFQEEFSEHIKTSGYFCLLDSYHSRRSDYVGYECRLALEAKALMMICRVETERPDKEWTCREHFDQHNYIRAIDFTDFDAGISLLFKAIGIAYHPAFQLPRDQDFEKELARSSLDLDRFQDLLNLYKAFREQFADPEFAEAQLRIIIKKCQHYGATEIVSPRLALGVMLADSGRHRDALQTFQAITESYPRDPRAWAGLGGAYFHLGDFESSLQALKRSSEVIRKFYPTESADRLPEVLHNIASVLLRLGRNREARSIMQSLTAEQRNLAYLLALEGRLLLSEGDAPRALSLLERAYGESCARYDVAPDLVISLADCYRHLGRVNNESELLEHALKQVTNCPELFHRSADCHLRNGDAELAAAALRNATECFPRSPLYRAQLAALLFEKGEVLQATLFAEESIRCGLTPQERYYRGLAYYIIGAIEAAEYDLNVSRKHAAVTNWPHYSAVVTPRTRAGRLGGRR